MHQKIKTQIHTPVLLDEVIEVLKPSEGESYLDLTAGYAGHAKAIIDITNNYQDSVLVDRDIQAINELHEVFQNTPVRIIHDDYLGASTKLIDEGVKFDLILADLGVSSLHLNEGNRGFSFQHEGPLDMRMDASQDLTAEKIVNNYSESDLAEILSVYGEEPKAKMIARLIVEARPINTTTELASIASKAWKGYSRSHPATRTFQALRIAVNDELDQLKKSLPMWLSLLNPGGRIAIITFHSLEDRIVKQFLNENTGSGYDSEYRLINKKPIISQKNELVHNPRARSAKLRAAVKIKIMEGS